MTATNALTESHPQYSKITQIAKFIQADKNLNKLILRHKLMI